MSTTVIRNAAWVIAWDEELGKQVYRRDVDLAFTGDRITFLGGQFSAAPSTLGMSQKIFRVPYFASTTITEWTGRAAVLVVTLRALDRRR